MADERTQRTRLGRPFPAACVGRGRTVNGPGVEARVAALETELQELRLKTDVVAEAMMLSEASRLIPKQSRICFVESEHEYGNLTSLAAAALREFGPERVMVLSRDEDSERRWRRAGVPSLHWQTAPGNAEVWTAALTAAVSVYEHHNWWRRFPDLTRRALLAGSTKVQLWHGRSAGFSKEFGMQAAWVAPGMFEFADLVTTSLGFDALVCEPEDEPVRLLEFAPGRIVHDVNFRMVQPLARRSRLGGNRQGPPRVLVAPTYPETERGQANLVERIRAYDDVASGTDAEVWLRLHPWTAPEVRKAAGMLQVHSPNTDLYEVLHTFDVVLTEMSSIASDFLLLGGRVVLDHSDMQHYRDERTVRAMDELLAVCDVAETPGRAMELATSTDDPLGGERRAVAEQRLARIGAEPGQPTLALLRELLERA